MKNKSILLIKTLLLSTSQMNICKHSTDKKKKRKAVISMVGFGILYLMIMFYGVIYCMGFGKSGMSDSIPVMCAMIVAALAAILTFFKTNGYLFNFKEYDMLMSLPFSTKTVAACKFMYMYINSLPWYMIISLAMLIGYAVYEKPAVCVYPIWIVLSFFLPVIPMLLASLLGFVVAWIGSHFKKSNLIQAVLMFAVGILAFMLRYIIEAVVKNGEVQDALEQSKEAIDNAAGVFLPARWFSEAVTKLSVSGILLLTGVSIILFVIVFMIVGGSYRRINSALKSHAAKKDYKVSAQKKRSVLNAIAFKEFRRMTGSTTYLVQGGFGEVLITIFSIITLVMGFDRIVEMITSGAPVDPAILRPAIPFFIYFFLGMVSTCACSPSLEGKNYWIVQSLPIEKKTLYKGKMLFNMYLTVPFMVFATICFCVSAKVPLVETILDLLLGFALLAFSTCWGCVCGVRHMRLDWENEIEVVKQSAAVSVYLLPNMFVGMGVIAGVVYLGMYVDHKLLAGGFILLISLLAALSYKRVMSLAKRR